MSHKQLNKSIVASELMTARWMKNVPEISEVTHAESDHTHTPIQIDKQLMRRYLVHQLSRLSSTIKIARTRTTMP